MVQIKLSIAFVLAAAAIAPIVAEPIREGHEFADNVAHRPHHHHQHHHHHHQRVANPEQSSLEPPSEHIHRPVHSEPQISAREYAEFDDVFERADSESGAGSSRRFRVGGRMQLGHGPVRLGGPAFRPFKGIGSHGLPLGLGLGGINRRPLIGLGKRPFGLAPVRGYVRHGLTPREYDEFEDMFERELEDGEFDAREYAEFDDMFERDLEDGEFDARDIEDDLYLD